MADLSRSERSVRPAELVGREIVASRATLQKFFREGVASIVSNRFRLDPGQSFVNAETKAADPGFWNPQ